MKKFIYQLIIFLLPIILAAYFIDLFISTYLKKSNTHAQKEYSTWNDIMDGKVNSDILIYGSSRAWSQINPLMISDSLNMPAYNIGIDGHNFWLEYLRHNLLLKYNSKPKVIIHSLDVFTLEKRIDLYNPDQFLPYMLWNKEIEKATNSYVGYNHFDYEVPLLRYFGKLDAIKTSIKLFVAPESNKIVRIKGYKGQTENWNSDFANAKNSREKYEVKLDSASIELFEKYLNDCKSMGIKIVFVYTPEYIEGQQFVVNRGKVIALYQQFSEKYDIPFFDYSSDSMSYQKKYFYNSQHLNKFGAEIFTDKLVEKLKDLNLKSISENKGK